MGFLKRATPALPRLFGPQIAVVVRPDSVEFRGRSRVISLSHDLFVHDGIIVSIGSPPATEAQRLPVFVADPQERARRLGKLIAYGLQTVLSRSFSIKPVVRLSVEGGPATAAEVTRALIDAGVAEVSGA